MSHVHSTALRIYTTVLSINENVLWLRSQTILFGSSVTLIDPLGRRLPVNLQLINSWEAFDAVLEVRFRNLPGHRKIVNKEFALLNGSNHRDLDRSQAFEGSLVPGQQLLMDMMFDARAPSGYRQKECPSCGSSSKCDLYFTRVERVLKSDELDDFIEQTPSTRLNELQPGPRPRIPVLDSIEVDSPDQFKRIGDKPPMRELLSAFIRLENFDSGLAHTFRGYQILSQAGERLGEGFKRLLREASEKCGFEVRTDVIVAEDGSWITCSNSMLRALEMNFNKSERRVWRIVKAQSVPRRQRVIYLDLTNPNPPKIDEEAPAGLQLTRKSSDALTQLLGSQGGCSHHGPMMKQCSICERLHPNDDLGMIINTTPPVKLQHPDFSEEGPGHLVTLGVQKCAKALARERETGKPYICEDAACYILK
ncbi:MAG: hypothetical protein Q9159_001521 [Coniocarpon cinnabarinum]